MIKTPLMLLASLALLIGLLMISVVAESFHIPNIQVAPFIIMSIILAALSFVEMEELGLKSSK
jgi:hypothetical protein